MSKRVTFTSEQLCKEWMRQAQATPKGNRGDVVCGLMEVLELDTDDENARKKVYNNVTQRVKNLSERGISFPSLTPGKKGARQNQEQLDALQSLMNEDEDCLVL